MGSLALICLGHYFFGFFLVLSSGYKTGLLFLLDWEYQWLGFVTRGPQCMLLFSLISKSDVHFLSESRPRSAASQQMQVGASPFSLSL